MTEMKNFILYRAVSPDEYAQLIRTGQFEIVGRSVEGKYFADVYIKGIYNQHFSKVITIKEKKNTYTFKLSKADPFLKEDVIIPNESNDFSKTSVALMK